MKEVPIPANDEERVAALDEYKILDTPYEEVFDNITRLAATISGATASQINLIDRHRLWVKSTFGMPGTEMPRNMSFCAHAILDNELTEVADASQDERFNENPFVLGDPNIRFYAGMPLTNPQGFNVGTLCVVDPAPKQLSTEQKEKMRGLSKIVMALFEARKAILQDIKEREVFTDALKGTNSKLKFLLAEQKKNLEVMQIFSQMNGMLQCCATNEEAYAIISSFSQKIFTTSSGMLYLRNHNYYEPCASWGNPCSVDDLFTADDCWALRRSQQYFTSGDKSELFCNHLKSSKSESTMCLPLIALSETIGLICLECNATESKDILNFNKESRRLLAVRMAEQIALSLANLRLRKKLREQSIKDPLTGLYNRRYFIEVFKKELPRAIRKKMQLAIIIIDIDHFKKFNDTFGHDAGDLVLQKISGVLKIVENGHDTACRWGGEEFALLIQDTSLEKIQAKTQKLKKLVSELRLEYSGKDLGQITLSQGVSFFPEHGSNLEDLINAADHALYRAKNNGRDRIVVFSK